MMSFSEYLVGVALLAVAVGPAVYGGVALRRRLLPGWSGALARVAETVVALATILLAAEALGAVDQFRRVPVAVGCAALGALVSGAARRGRPAAAQGPEPAPAQERTTVIAAFVGAALVFGAWASHAITALREGMYGTDTLGYHGPVAARFVQDREVFQLLFLADDLTITYLPFNSELLHAVVLLLIGSDVLSPLINLGFLALALLGAWSIGRQYGVGPASLAGVCLVMAAPVLTLTQPGSGDSDVAGLAFLLAAAAVLARGRLEPASLALAGLATGLAVGTKPTTFAAAGVLTAGVAVAWALRVRSGRASPRFAARACGVWAGMVLLGGGAWFLRNLVQIGNPVPWVTFELGPLSLDAPPIYSSTAISHYLGDLDIWREVFFPGLRTALGPFWWLEFALAIGGMVAAIAFGRGWVERLLGVTAAVAVIVYLFLPNSAAGPEGFPIFFEHAVRYATPALAVGLALLPVWPPAARFAARPALVAAMGLLVLLTLRGSGTGFFEPERLIPTIAVLALLLAATRPRWAPRRRLVPAVVAAALVTLGLGWVVQRSYQDGRYADGEFAWARGLEDTRIALTGSFRQYHLYGNDFSNTVRYVNRPTSDGTLLPIRTCAEWRRVLARGRYRYVVTTPEEFLGSFNRDDPPATRWTRAAPGAVQILRKPDRTTVFRLDRPVKETGCG